MSRWTSTPKQVKRGRPHKFSEGAPVYMVEQMLSPTKEEIDVLRPCVVVDWKHDGDKSYYRVIRVHQIRGGQWRAYGATKWLASHLLTPREGSNYPSILRTYQANQRLGKEGMAAGCSCHCCVHSTLPNNSVREDGTYKWENEHD